MIIDSRHDGPAFIIKVSGRVDTLTAPELDKTIKDELGDSSSLIIDFSDLEYISSAGLRVLLAAQKVMNRQGSMTIRNVKPAVMDVFEVTGFSSILTIE